MLPRVARVECSGADYLLFATGDAISNALFRTGGWEVHLQSISRMFYSGMDAPLVLDIGANLGGYSIPIARAIQSAGGKVIGFEPQRIVYYQLCANIILNRLDNYHAFHQAAADFEGAIEIPEIDYQRNGNVGAFSFNPQYRRHHGIEHAMKPQKTSVPVTMLDKLSVDRAPALIKLDVEGFELNVLKGACGFLEEHRYPPLIFEAWSHDWFEAGRRELMRFVEGLGYGITSLRGADYVAQHPLNAVSVDFVHEGNGVVKMHRRR